ncbi:MAG: hypothetical protein ACM3MJ_02780 [Deltaproteobacteria bacterium]
MSDTPTADVNAPDEASAAGAAKAPARPVAEIRADIERERAGLDRSFAALRGDLDEAVDAGRQRAARARRKAVVVVPAAATALVAALFLRSRRRGRG